MPNNELDVITDRAGREVDVSGSVWQLNHHGEAKKLNWAKLTAFPPEVLSAAKGYTRHEIRILAPDSVTGTFYMFGLLNSFDSFWKNYSGEIELTLFELLREHPNANSAEKARYRQWYRWAAIHRYAGFSMQVADLQKRIDIGADKRPARIRDPERGALTDSERQALLDQIANATEDELPLRERVALLLAMFLGPNSGPLSLLQVQDFSSQRSGGKTFHTLKVPRQKKRYEHERSAFRERPIAPAYAPLLEQLIAKNVKAAEEIYQRLGQPGRPQGVAIPIIMRDRPRKTLTPLMQQYALHMTPREFSGMLNQAAESIGAKSRFGETLKLNARRLRTTFATNLIADGHSRQVIADALDHSSTATLKHYVEYGSRLVPTLDAHIGSTLTQMSGLFLGRVAEPTSADKRLPHTRIFAFDTDTDKLLGLGNCSADTACSLPVPFSCYTCKHFNTWNDAAAHQSVRDQLLKHRKRRAAERHHPRIVALQDCTIQALSELIRLASAQEQ